LLTVIGVLVLLGLLLTPALARTRVTDQVLQCRNNLRQLTHGWRMYADDNNDALVANDNAQGPTWCAGYLDWGTSPDNTNTVYLTQAPYALMAPYYGRQAKLFKCPADTYASASQRALGWSSRARSISMDAAMGAGVKVFSFCRPIKKISELVQPPPAMAWVLVDEHPDSINDSMFYVDQTLPPASANWMDWPASYHDGACGISFADGHSEIQKWQDSRTVVPVRYVTINNLHVANSVDFAWLAQRTPP
jgi:prepilin-type processing-associated H-X9-DG protein